MAIGDSRLSAGLGSYDPNKNYFALPSAPSLSNLNIGTVPGQSKLDAYNALLERLGKKPVTLDQIIAPSFSASQAGPSRGQQKQQQMTVGEYDIDRKMAALERPNLMTQTTSALQDDPGDIFLDGQSVFTTGDFEIPSGYIGDDTSDLPVLRGGTDDMGSGVPLGGSYPDDESITDTGTGTGTGKTDAEAEAFRKLEETRALSQGIQLDQTIGQSDSQTRSSASPRDEFGYEKLMQSALDSYNQAIGRAPSGAKSMAEYKKEFSDATGIDISGDPDNKAAMTAFGLALMQNKAGKGFNVGRLLSEVGAAGEKALPLMESARKEARAGQLAAGQYALSSSAADKATRTKFLVDQAQYLRDRQDKIIDYAQTRRDTLVDDAAKRRHDLNMEAVKHGFSVRQKEIEAQIDAVKNDKFDKITEFQLLPNITALKIQRGFDGKKPVYADPGSAANQVAETYKDVQVKLSMVDDLENILTKLANEGDQAFGGQVGKILFDRVNKYSKVLGGPYANVFNERGITAESEARVIIDAFVQANKRFISQETGNGVSDGDKKDIRTVTGEIVLTDSLDTN